MSVICKIDGSIHETVKELHAYLRRFKITQKNYYLEYYAKQDLFSGKPIPFKTYDQYIRQDFVSKTTLKQWVKANPKEGRAWVIDWLRQRKDKKKLVYSMPQVELRTLTCPRIEYYDTVGGYNNICKDLGFKIRYDCEDFSLKSLDEDNVILYDTREQKPLTFAMDTSRIKLDFGDYALKNPHEINLAVERKSLNDFAGSLNKRKVVQKKGDSSAFQRLENELDRAVESNGYVVMVVECSLTDALSFNYRPEMRWGRVSPSHVFKNMRDLLAKYPLHFQVLFTEGRTDSADKIIKLFQLGKRVKSIDLQLAADKGLI